MSVLTNQSAINPNKAFWLPSQGISTITVTNLNTNTISTNSITAQESFISSISTNALDLDGGFLTTQNGNTLLLNGIPIVTTSNLSTLADWALDPAISTIKPLNTSIDVGFSNLPFRTGYFSTIVARNAIIQSTTLTLTETVSSLFVNDLFTSTITSQVGTFSTLNAQTASISSLAGAFANFSTLQAQNATFNNLNVSTANISSMGGGGGSASNWWQFPAKGDVLFQPDPFGNPVWSLSSVKDITCGNITAQIYGFPTPLGGGQITGAVIDGIVGNYGTIKATTVTASNNTQTGLVEVYGVNKPPGFNALYVNGGLTVDGGVAVHGITLGTNTAGVSLNRIDILPVGTQDYITWGAQAFVAGLGTTIDAGLGINIAAGLVVDVLGADVKLRANSNISLDATKDIRMLSDKTSLTTNTLDQKANTINITDTNFTINSSNTNTFNATVLTAGTPLPPSTIGYYSTFQQNSQILNSPLGAILTAQSLYGLYQNISTTGFVVTSNISTTYTPSTTGLLSSYTSTITSSFVRSYSTLSILQSFPVGEVSIKPSSLLLQHADKIELDTKPFPIFTNLTPGLSSIVSSLYTYEAITDGAKYSEIGQIIQTIVPKFETFSTNFLSTGVSSGTILSTLTSSFFSTLISDQSFTSSIYNQILFNSNAFSTPSILVSTLNGQRFPYPYGSFSVNKNQTIGVPNTAVSTIFDTTETANGISIVGVSSPLIAVSTSGIYRWLASPQFNTTSGGTNPVSFWFLQNGSNIPRSASRATVANNNTLFSAVEIMTPMNKNDTLSFCFTSSDTNMNLAYLGATGVVPEAPALILTGQKIAEK